MAEKERKPPMGGMRPGPKGRGAVEKAKDFKGTTKKLIKNYLANYKISLMIVFIFAVGSTIFSVIGPKILGNATTNIYRFNWKNIWNRRNKFRENSKYIINIISAIYCKCSFFNNTRIYNDRNCTKTNI